jgi:hypothetical protein
MFKVAKSSLAHERGTEKIGYKNLETFYSYIWFMPLRFLSSQKVKNSFYRVGESVFSAV